MNGLIKKITPALCATLVSLTVIASDIPAQYPLFNVGRSAPNIMFTIDDSGSMKRDYMPESLDDPNTAAVECSAPSKSLNTQYGLTTNVTVSLCKASNVNHLYYNPSVTYKPRVDYLNQSLGNGTGTCTDPVFTETGSSTTPSTTTTTTTTKKITYSQCAVTTIYKYTPGTAGTPAQGKCTQTTKLDNELAVDTFVPAVAASDCTTKTTTTWVDDKSTTQTSITCTNPAVAAYYAVPAGYQTSPYYTSTTTKHSTKYRYCQNWSTSAKYKTTSNSCNQTSVNNPDCATYVPAIPGTLESTQNGIAKCTKKTETTTVVNGVSSSTTETLLKQTLPQKKLDGTDGKCGQALCAAKFTTLGQAYNYPGTNPVTTVSGPNTVTTPAIPHSATKTLNKTGVCEYLKYTPADTATTDDKTATNYTHVMLDSQNHVYDSRQNGVSGRTDCKTGNTLTADACTYEQEKQNFLNWQTYYKTRLDVTKTMIGLSFAALDTRFRVGFAKINSSPAVVRDVAEFTKDGANSPRALFFSDLYSINSNNSLPDGNPTPLRRAMDQVGQYFTNSARWDGSICRLTYNITMTDGNWTSEGATVATGNVDNTTSPSITRPSQTAYVYFPAAPYKDEHFDTLADVAMYYWNHDLVSGLDNSVTASVADPAVWQHITQYTIGFGVQGRATKSQKEAGQWPDPRKDNFDNVVLANTPTDAKTDDLEHAAINARGAFFNASNPAEFENALTNTLGAIDAASQTGSASAVAAVSNDYTASTLMFQAGFEPGWVGRLDAFTLSSEGNLAKSWSASIPAVSANRHIFTLGADDSSVEFLWDNLSATQQTALNLKGDDGSKVVDFIRGDKTTELAPSLFRHRTSLLGDIVNSNVIYAGKDDYGYAGINGYTTFLNGKQSKQNMVYVGANDGMLHAFNATTGVEAFAYIPSELVTKLRYLADSGYASNHKYYVDGSPIAGDIKIDSDWKTLLVGTAGAGGKSIFGLDVSDPENFDAADVLWELSPANAASPDDLGYSIPKPSIARTGSATWQVLVANGYGSVNGSAQLLRLNANTGEVANTIDMEATGSNGLSSPAVVDKDGDGIADLAYAGDLNGNIWRINLANNSKFKVFQACDGACATSNFQPITTKLDVRANPEGGFQILFGTGRYFSADDNTLSDPPRVEAIYGIRDNNNETTLMMSSLVAQNITAEYAVDAVATRAGTNTTVKTRVISNNSVDYNSKAGWYLPLKSPGLVNGVGERVVNDVSLVDDKLVVTTLIPESGVSGNACATGGTTWVMEIDPISGGRLQYSALNTNSESSVINKNDDLSDGNGGYVVASGVLQDGSTAPLILDKTSTTQKKVFTNLNGSVSALDEVSDSGAEGRQSWRQIR